MKVPDGFHVTRFAAEPDVRQPIDFCIDDRGRLWVAEAHNYPDHNEDRTGDRIVILDDTNGDGEADQRTVFTDQLNYITGIEVGFGGVWVMSPPFFYFIPDRDGDDLPDGEPELLLDGFGNHANAHNLANGFAWGPDGWLYGTHGRTNWSLPGKPGTTEGERVRFDGGVYRYHPVTRVFEPWCDGTTNPWGIDWNDYGQAFITNCVNPHLFHAIEGAHYEPWRGRQSSLHAYRRIETIADHLHFTGSDNVRDGLGSRAEHEAGGGHAHCGVLVYLGDNWPGEKYRNTVFMNNIHGRRINNDRPVRHGSGYTATHGPDLMLSEDPWFMGVTLETGPRGAVYVSDWSDTGECHSYRNTRRQTGRIYRIVYGEKPARASVKDNLAALTDPQLVERHLHLNDFHVRHARRILHERHTAGSLSRQTVPALRRIYAENPDVTRQLRALWTLHVLGALDSDFLTAQLNRDNEHLRAWAVRLLCEDRDPPPAALEAFRRLAVHGDSPLVRLQLSSGLQRLGHQPRWPVLEALAQRSEDAADQNLPLMLWYAVEPLVPGNPERAMQLAANTEIPLLRRHIARRLAFDANLDPIVTLLTGARNDETGYDLLAGTLDGLEGRRSVPMPARWPAAFEVLRQSSRPEVREAAIRVALVFDDPAALAALRHTAADPEADSSERNRAFESLLAKKPGDLAPLLLRLLDDPAVRSAALRGLAQYEHPGTVSTILDRYAGLDLAARRDALQTLATRPIWANALLDAVESGRVPRSDLTAYTARQLNNLGDKAIAARVTSLWGDLREPPAAKRKQIAAHKRRLTPEALARADPAAGRATFQQLCAACHSFFGEGGQVGPELTGSQRTSLDYLLENLVDPSASVAGDYRMNIVTTRDGRTLTGFVALDTETALTLQTLNEKIVLPRAEIAGRKTSPVSLMPEGLLQTLSQTQIRDLIAYLASPRQVPLPDR